MLRPKTAHYPWKCFGCEGIFDSMDEAAIIWVTPEGEVMHACADCEDITHIEDITCLCCFQTFTAVYTDDHDEVTCSCGHVHDLHGEEDCGCSDCN